MRDKGDKRDKRNERDIRNIRDKKRHEETKRNEEKTVKIALENFAFGTDRQTKGQTLL